MAGLGRLVSAFFQAVGLGGTPGAEPSGASPVPSAEVQVGLLPNGASWKVAPEVRSVSSWESLQEQVAASGMEGLGSSWWLADPDGLRIHSWADILALPADKRTLNVIPEGRPYQWGARRAGERWPIKLAGKEGVEMETVASKPGIFLIHNLFTEEEAMFLIDRATRRTGDSALKSSGIGLSTAGVRNVNSIRTSSNAFDSESPGAVDLIERSFHALRMNYSKPMADGLQILRYELGQAYINHTDWFAPGTSGDDFNFDPTTGGSNRYATVFLYLWPPPTGGYTVFPKAHFEEGVRSSEHVSVGDDTVLMEDQVRQATEHYKKGNWEIDMTRACYSKLAVKPVRLGASLFYHQDPMTGKLLKEAEHGACPSMTGTKWGANLWIWNRDRLQVGGSPGAHKQVPVTFKNTHSAPLVLEYSTDDQASWHAFATVQPGESTSSGTYANHGWRWTRDGQIVRMWSVPPGSETGLFESRPTNSDL